MADSLSAQASQAAQEGQQLLSQDQSEAATNKTAYDTAENNVTSSNQQLQSEANYMQGAGSGQNVYNSELGTLENSAGYDPAQLSSANKTLFSLTGALNGANSQFNSPGGGVAGGLNASQMAGYEGSILNPLTTGVNTANTEVGTLNNELGTFETGASQATTNQVQSEQQVVTALTAAVQNYQAQANAALSNMQFYSNLAQQQGSLNAQEQQNYAAATQAYAAAQQAISQSKLLLSQTTNQNIVNTADINQLPKGTTIDGLTSNGSDYQKTNVVTPSAPTPNKTSTPAKSSSGGFISELESPFKDFAESI